MRTVLVALGLALVSLPALAEGLQTTNRSEEQQKSDKEADSAYKAMIKNCPTSRAIPIRGPQCAVMKRLPAPLRPPGPRRLITRRRPKSPNNREFTN